jgi:C1A family cysteine protease
MKRTVQIATLLAAVTLWLATAAGAAASPMAPAWAASLSGHLDHPGGAESPTWLEPSPRSQVFKAYAPSFDLRALGRVTPVKDQGMYGTCWAFASLGSLESGLLASDPTVWDFSEDNLAWFSDFSVGSNPLDAGGNSFMALAYLARWGGPVSETDDPYGDGAHPPGCPAQLHLKEAVFVAPRTSSTDNDGIKEALTTYGAVDVDMHWSWDASHWNGSTDSHYYTEAYSDGIANHDVLVVGWDDAYPAEAFATPPPGPGAFIVKNSWGTSWDANDDGYFYVSYHDTAFAHGVYNMAFVDADPVYDFVGVYQYDPLGFWPEDGPYVSGMTSWFANVFTAEATEDLAAVGFYTSLDGCAYEVYSSPTSGAPSFAGLVAYGSGTIAEAGYHVVPLAATIPLASGQPFTVAVKLTVPDASYHYPIPVERPYPGYSDATADPGQSYVCRDGSTWEDLTSLVYYGEANVCLKGFTTGAPSGSFTVNGGKAYTKSAAVELTANVAGAAEMSYRDAGGSWSAWEPFVSTRAWTLPTGDGPKTVEAAFRNAQGTTTHSDGIFLDTHRPETRAPYKRSVRRYEYVRLYYKVADAVPCAAKATVTIKIKTLGGTTKQTLKLGQRSVNKLLSYRFRCTLAKRTYRYYVYATDAAGNTQSPTGRNYLYVK